MKITQAILLNAIAVLSNDAAYTLQDPRVLFDPSLFTGISKIYFECDGRKSVADAAGNIELYNITDGTSIAGSELTINQASWTRLRSGDLSAVLTAAKNIGIRMKRTGAAGFTMACGIKLIIQHESEAANRKSATYVKGLDSRNAYGTSWYSISYGWIFPKLDQYDGTVKCKMECFLKTEAGATAEARLYDETDNEVVSGSEVSTNEEGWTRVQTNELSLVDGHDYRWQLRSNTAAKYAYYTTPFLRITSEGFNKLASICAAFGKAYVAAIGAWVAQGGSAYFEPAFIDGVDSLVYKLWWAWYEDTFDPYDVWCRLYDSTTPAAIAGTTHNETGPGSAMGYFDDDPTMPGAAKVLVLQNKDDSVSPGTFTTGQGLLYAFQREDLPAPPSLPADPTQPTGYHCFMSQFILNMIAGLVPLETPDGVNKCW